MGAKDPAELHRFCGIGVSGNSASLKDERAVDGVQQRTTIRQCSAAD